MRLFEEAFELLMQVWWSFGALDVENTPELSQCQFYAVGE